MTDLTTAGSKLLAAHRPERGGLLQHPGRALSWIWASWRRRDLINTLRRVDDRLLRDAGIERSEVEDVVDGLISRRR